MEKLFLYLARQKLLLRYREIDWYEITYRKNITGFEPDPKHQLNLLKQGQGGQQRNSTPKETKSRSTNRSSNNSFGPRRPNTNNDVQTKLSLFF
jgi:hypothetical protein